MEKNSEKYKLYLDILRSELVPAMGCTEPIALAYTGARARKLCKTGFCDCKLAENVPNLYIIVRAEGKGHCAEMEIRDSSQPRCTNQQR